MCQDSLLSGGGRSVPAKISGGSGHPWGIFFGLYKTRHILLSDSANCTVLRAVVLTQYRRVTDGQTDGIVPSTALAKRHAVKRSHYNLAHNFAKCCPIFRVLSLTDSLVNLTILPHLPPPLKRVTTLPCEILISEN